METTLKNEPFACIAKEVSTSPLSLPPSWTFCSGQSLSGGLWPQRIPCSEECECEREKMVAKDKNNEADLSLMIGYFLSHLLYNGDTVPPFMIKIAYYLSYCL